MDPSKEMPRDILSANSDAAALSFLENNAAKRIVGIEKTSLRFRLCEEKQLSSVTQPTEE